jgi:plastocyanin
MISTLRRYTSRATVVLALMPAAAAASLGCNTAPPPTTPTAAAPSATQTAPKVTPRIVGNVVFGPTREALKTGGVVYLEDGPRQPDAGTAAAMDVHDKRFTPLIAVVTTGGTVRFGNRDALTHHVFSPDIPGWDSGYLHKNDSTPRRFDSPGAFAMLCNIHPEMIGYVLVTPSSYYGMIGADGSYAIGGVPPGTYRITAWAPRLQSVTQSVTVSGIGAATALFELSPAMPTK